jgi:hypothetical protein
VVEGDGIDRAELGQIVLVGAIVTIPCHHVERREGLLGAEQVALELRACERACMRSKAGEVQRVRACVVPSSNLASLPSSQCGPRCLTFPPRPLSSSFPLPLTLPSPPILASPHLVHDREAALVVLVPGHRGGKVPGVGEAVGTCAKEDKGQGG